MHMEKKVENLVIRLTTYEEKVENLVIRLTTLWHIYAV